MLIYYQSPKKNRASTPAFSKEPSHSHTHTHTYQTLCRRYHIPARSKSLSGRSLDLHWILQLGAPIQLQAVSTSPTLCVRERARVFPFSSFDTTTPPGKGRLPISPSISSVPIQQPAHCRACVYRRLPLSFSRLYSINANNSSTCIIIRSLRRDMYAIATTPRPPHLPRAPPRPIRVTNITCPSKRRPSRRHCRARRQRDTRARRAFHPPKDRQDGTLQPDILLRPTTPAPFPVRPRSLTSASHM